MAGTSDDEEPQGAAADRLLILRRWRTALAASTWQIEVALRDLEASFGELRAQSGESPVAAVRNAVRYAGALEVQVSRWLSKMSVTDSTDGIRVIESSNGQARWLVQSNIQRLNALRGSLPSEPILRRCIRQTETALALYSIRTDLIIARTYDNIDLANMLKRGTPAENDQELAAILPAAMTWPEVTNSIAEAAAVGKVSEAIETMCHWVPEQQIGRLTALGSVATGRARLEQAEAALDEAVSTARNNGATWADIGRVFGISTPAALRRWDPDARQRHSNYRRRKPAE